MKVCKFAKSLGKPCNDGYSKLVECEVDGVVRCLKECMPGCGDYREVDEPEPPKPPKKVTRTQYTSVGANTANTTYKGGCGAPCGKSQPHRPSEVPTLRGD